MGAEYLAHRKSYRVPCEQPLLLDALKYLLRYILHPQVVLLVLVSSWIATLGLLSRTGFTEMQIGVIITPYTSWSFPSLFLQPTTPQHMSLC